MQLENRAKARKKSLAGGIDDANGKASIASAGAA